MMFFRIFVLLISLLLPAAESFAPSSSVSRNTLLSLRGGGDASSGGEKDDPFPVVSRFVGGTWKNIYAIFNGIEFERGEDRVRYTQWTLNHETEECEVSLRPEEAPEGSPPIVLKGKHIGNGVIRFGGFGNYEYLFRQVGTDTILISRTEGTAENDEETGPRKLDFGSMVLTDDNSCVQTIAHTEDANLSMLEVIRGTREL